MNIVSLADICYRELDSPDDTSIPNIVFFLTANLSQLNTLIGSSYSLDDNQEPTPELGDSESVILKYIYLIHYYNRIIRSNLQAGAYDVMELQEGDTTIRQASRNELAKSYNQLKMALEDRLHRLISSYKQNGVIPASLSAAHDLVRFYRV